MKAKALLLGILSLSALGVLVILTLPSCSFEPSRASPAFCDLLADLPLKKPASSDRQVVFEEPGTIIVHHGFTCAESNNSGREDILKVEETLDLPIYATNATVFLNGWRFRYLSKDHHVAGLSTAIANIRIEQPALKWRAAGILSDDDFDDGYRWCYWYTVAAWNDAALALIVDHDDGCDAREPGVTNLFAADNVDTTTALSSFRSFLLNPQFAPSRTVAILPRGFGFVWEGILDSSPDDHHLFQLGYNLNHSEIFAQNGKAYRKEALAEPLSLPNSASQVDSGFVTWETSAIFKDNDGRRDYGFGEIVSGLSGGDVGVIEPPFSILPEEDAGPFTGSIITTGTLRTEGFAIEQVPFEFAIPMLTGWDLIYESNDAHVKEVGMSLDGWTFDRTTRTLRYTLSSVLRDKEDEPGHREHHKVTILGLRPITVTGTPREQAKGPDLAPFSPEGTSPAAFCRLDARRQLRVPVRNQGSGDAGASRTTVSFEGLPVTQETPTLPAGGSVELLFKIPGNCFDPECSFTITVDANNKVDEGDHEGNNSANGLCTG